MKSTLWSYLFFVYTEENVSFWEGKKKNIYVCDNSGALFCQPFLGYFSSIKHLSTCELFSLEVFPLFKLAITQTAQSLLFFVLL